MNENTLKKLKIFSLSLFLCFYAVNIYAQETIGRFIDIKGDVALRRMKTMLKPNINDLVQIKDLVITGNIARTKLMFIDSSLLTIGNNSKVEISDFLLDKKERNGIILLKVGAIHAKAEKFLEQISKFEVRTPTAVIGARGTEWFTYIKEDMETVIFSISDRVSVFNPAYPNKPVEIKEGYFTSVEKGKLPKKPEAYCPSDLYVVMKQWGAEEVLSKKKLNSGKDHCVR